MKSNSPNQKCLCTGIKYVLSASLSWLIYPLAIALIYKIFQPHIYALVTTTTTTTTSLYPPSMKIPNLGDQYIISPKIQSTSHIDQIIHDVHPKSWVSLLTDQEAGSYQYAYIESHVKRTNRGDKDEDGNIQFYRIGVDTSLLGTDVAKDIELAKKIVRVLETAPKPVIIQSISGRRASAVYALMHAQDRIDTQEARYDEMVKLSRESKLAWVGSESHSNFVKTYLAHMHSGCVAGAGAGAGAGDGDGNGMSPSRRISR